MLTRQGKIALRAGRANARLCLQRYELVKMKLIVILISMLLISSCEKSDSETQLEKVQEVMGWLYEANPEHDVQVAIENGDFRFMGVYGYSIVVPRIDTKCLDYEKDINPIKGTSDAIESYEHAKLNAIARVYAGEYNFRMRIYKEENTEFKCGS